MRTKTRTKSATLSLALVTGLALWRQSLRSAHYRHRHNSRVAENSGCTTHETNSERITACPKK